MVCSIYAILIKQNKKLKKFSGQSIRKKNRVDVAACLALNINSRQHFLIFGSSIFRSICRVCWALGRRNKKIETEKDDVGWLSGKITERKEETMATSKEIKRRWGTGLMLGLLPWHDGDNIILLVYPLRDDNICFSVNVNSQVNIFCNIYTFGGQMERNCTIASSHGYQSAHLVNHCHMCALCSV